MKVKCQGCGEVKEIPDKPAPKCARESKQILFNCQACGAVNYRDGTARPNKNNMVKINKAKSPAPAPVQPKEVANADIKEKKEPVPGPEKPRSGIIPWLG